MQATTKALGILVIVALVGCEKERDPVTVGTGNQGASGTGGNQAAADGGSAGAAGGSGGSTGGSGSGGAAGAGATGGSGGGTGIDARPSQPAADAGNATGPKCGAATCAAGMVCCNASCGICAPPNGACIQLACDPKPPAGGACRTDADCRLFDDYCTGCDCRALARSDPNPVCNSAGVMCYRQPCGLKVALCQSGRCVTVNVPL